MNLNNFFNNIIFEKIISENDTDIKKILEIRNEEKVRNSMINDEIIIFEKHKSWISGHLYIYMYFSIMILNKLIGLITLDINEKKNVSWAFYISEKTQKGLGALIELKFLDFFLQLLEKGSRMSSA